MTTALPPRTRAARSLRPVGQIVAFVVVCLLVLGVLEVSVELLVGPRIANWRDTILGWLSLAAVVFTTWLMLRKVDKLPWSTVGLDRGAARSSLIIGGALLGGLTIGVASVLLLAGHMMRFDAAPDGSWWSEAGRAVLMLLPAAFFEELIIRGYVFAVLRRMAGWRTALIITSVVFGLLHAWNPGADAESILAVVVAGFFLGAILLATRSLYAAGAAHFAWNWVMAGALHIAVSGMPSNDVDYRMVETGPDWLTGGPWGPEGGLAAVLVMFVGIFYLYGRYLRRMEWKA